MSGPNGVMLPAHAVDAEELLVAWLTPLNPAGVIHNVGDPLPFILVKQIGGIENPNQEIAEPLVSVHTLCAASDGYMAATVQSDKTHRAMLELARFCGTITLTGGVLACVDYVTVVESPTRQPYEDIQVLRKVGRYKLGLSYVPVTS